jgi:glyoxylase-like metal-dependent hydrolase (beta-lactamase superfamily II)
MKFNRLPLGVFQTNCYIVFDENTKEAAVIDPAGDFPEIKSFIETNGLKVKYIIITHAHGDHIGALKELKDYSNAAVCLHKEDEEMLKSKSKNFSGMMGGTAVEMTGDRFLEDGDVLELGETKLNIIHTPGHSRGGISIYCGKVLFSGDTLFQNSVGRTDLYGGSMTELIKSIREKLFILPDDTAVYPGHGPSTTILDEKQQNSFV